VTKIRQILIYETDTRKREKLAGDIRSHLRIIGLLHIEFHFYSPRDIHDKLPPKAAWAAFFSLDSPNDAEAARIFGAEYPEIPLVVVSGSAEYGRASWSWGTRFYLKRPFQSDELQNALLQCFA
jgi:hypothetical protein